MDQEATTLFSGTFERSMDAKKRVAVPASWLSKDEGELFHVVPHPTDGYLMVMPPAEFAQQEQRFEAAPLDPIAKRMAIRKFYSEAHATTTDKQGRILLTEKHCERAGLVGDIVFVGGRSRFEIWNPERHVAADRDQTEAYQRVAAAVGL